MHRYSGITVSKFLELETMKRAKVLAGKNGINRRIIKLNVMEVPDIVNWVEEGEFLLTTAYNMRDNIDELHLLIEELNQKGIAGIGIKTKRYINEIPVKSIETANRLNFPLIEVPYDMSYSDILIEGLAEIVNAHANILARIDNIQTKLINVMLSGGGLEEIAKAIHESIDKNAIAIKDYMFDNRIILCDESDRKYTEDIVEKEKTKRKEFQKIIKNIAIYPEHMDILGDRKVRRINIPIYSEDTQYGCILIWEDKKSLTPLEISVIEAASSIIALDIYKKISSFEFQSKKKIEFLDDLFSGDEERYNEAREKGFYYGLDDKLNYSVINISIKEKDVKGLEDLDYIQKSKVKLLNAINRIGQRNGINIISATKDDNLIILYGSEANREEKIINKNIREFSEEILNYTKYEYGNKDIHIGVGRSYDNLKDIWRSFKESDRAVGYQLNSLRKSITFYDELGIYKILSFEGLKPELEQLYAEGLQSLVEYDMEKKTDLVLTLKKYFEYEGNLKEVSKQLYIHYNTVAYRMQRIKEITGKDFQDYDDRLSLQIALKVYETYKHKDEPYKV